MREINLIVVHCSATRADRDFTENDLEVCHRHRGFKPGAHALGYNARSIGICYEGGLDVRYRPADTRTEWQKHSLRVLIRTLLMDYPGCRVCGHRDLSPDRNGDGRISPEEWVKECPCFEVTSKLYE